MLHALSLDSAIHLVMTQRYAFLLSFFLVVPAASHLALLLNGYTVEASGISRGIIEYMGRPTTFVEPSTAVHIFHDLLMPFFPNWHRPPLLAKLRLEESRPLSDR